MLLYVRISCLVRHVIRHKWEFRVLCFNISCFKGISCIILHMYFVSYHFVYSEKLRMLNMRISLFFIRYIVHCKTLYMYALKEVLVLFSICISYHSVHSEKLCMLYMRISNKKINVIGYNYLLKLNFLSWLSFHYL